MFLAPSHTNRQTEGRAFLFTDSLPVAHYAAISAAVASQLGRVDCRVIEVVMEGLQTARWKYLGYTRNLIKALVGAQKRLPWS